MTKNKHLIVKKYLEKHSLVESNITSFNEFIEQRMQEIVDEISESIINDDFEISLGKIKAGKPLNLLNDTSNNPSLFSEIITGILYVPFNENNLKLKLPLLSVSMNG